MNLRRLGVIATTLGLATTAVIAAAPAASAADPGTRSLAAVLTSDGNTFDQDTNDVNPFLNPRALDLNAGNAQVAHGIVFVLRPLDL